MAKKSSGRFYLVRSLLKAIRQNEERKRRRWLDELDSLSGIENPLRAASRVTFIVDRILEETNSPRSLVWPFAFKPEHHKLAQDHQSFAMRFDWLENCWYMRAHDGERLDDTTLKAQGGDDEALVRVIEWNSLLMFEPWVRDRVADLIWNHDEVLFKRIVKAFQTNRRFHSKAKMHPHMKLTELLLQNAAWLGKLETVAERKAVKQELGDELNLFAEHSEEESDRLDKTGRRKAAAERRKDARIALRAVELVDGDASYYKVLRYARALSRRRKLAVNT